MGNGDNLDDVAGIAFVREGVPIITNPRERIPDLNTLLPPDYSYGFDLMRSSGLGFVITSRGCPVRCIYCSTSSYWGQKVRTISPVKVVDEMENLVEQCGVNKILFHDDTFNLTIGRTNDICNEILKRGVKVDWGIAARVHPVTQGMIDLMVEAGCRHICWGIESGSKTIMDGINKKISHEQIWNAYECCRKHSEAGRLSTGAFAMVGNVGESNKTIEESIEFLNTVPMTDHPSTTILYLLPGTLLYEKQTEITDDFWVMTDGLQYGAEEHDQSILSSWATAVSNSGKIIPFDKTTHFWYGILIF